MKSLLTRDNSRLKLEVLARSSEISPSLVSKTLLNSEDGRRKYQCRNGRLAYREHEHEHEHKRMSGRGIPMTK